jgi:hypothetical protein
MNRQNHFGQNHGDWERELGRNMGGRNMGRILTYDFVLPLPPFLCRSFFCLPKVFSQNLAVGW